MTKIKDIMPDYSIIIHILDIIQQRCQICDGSPLYELGSNNKVPISRFPGSKKKMSS